MVRLRRARVIGRFTSICKCFVNEEKGVANRRHRRVLIAVHDGQIDASRDSNNSRAVLAAMFRARMAQTADKTVSDSRRRRICAVTTGVNSFGAKLGGRELKSIADQWRSLIGRRRCAVAHTRIARLRRQKWARCRWIRRTNQNKRKNAWRRMHVNPLCSAFATDFNTM